MIEPIRGQVGAYDISCSGCGVVERFTELRLGLLLVRLRAKGWRVLSGRHYCPECEAPLIPPSITPLRAA
jgi:RNase P subunit RPR2